MFYRVIDIVDCFLFVPAKQGNTPSLVTNNFKPKIVDLNYQCFGLPLKALIQKLTSLLREIVSSEFQLRILEHILIFSALFDIVKKNG